MMAHKRNKLSSPIVDWLNARRCKAEEGEKKPSGRWSWRRILLIALAIWLIVVFHQPLYRFIVGIPVASLNHSIRGTDPNSCKAQPHQEQHPVQSQSIDPHDFLKWDDDAKVAERRSVSTITAHNGICFVDAVPPQTSVKLKFACLNPGTLPWASYLTEYDPSIGFYNPQGLQTLSASKKDVRAGLLGITEFNSRRPCMQEFVVYNNLSGSTDAATLNEMYLQLSDMQTHGINCSREDAKGVHQYIVEVGKTPTSFVLKNRNFTWLWVVPVHHPDWECTVNGVSIPSTGVDDSATRAAMQDCKEVDQNKNPFSLIVTGFTEHPKVLDRGVLSKPRNAFGQISLRINAPRGVQNLKPAKVIVGYQL